MLEIQIVGAASERAAREVGRAIARSALVKTAIFGADPNWGRVLAAAGAAGIPLAADRLSLQAAGDGDWITLATGVPPLTRIPFRPAPCSSKSASDSTWVWAGGGEVDPAI
jgi:N-acetylglutamate synthase/N-acetylornithine aminotransferase